MTFWSELTIVVIGGSLFCSMMVKQAVGNWLEMRHSPFISLMVIRQRSPGSRVDRGFVSFGAKKVCLLTSFLLSVVKGAKIFENDFVSNLWACEDLNLRPPNYQFGALAS